MGYVMVSADFPKVTGDKRQAIYDCLKQEQWVKVTGDERDITTTWYALFKTDVTGEEAIRISIDDFQKCAKPCVPRLVLHFGPNKPTY